MKRDELLDLMKEARNLHEFMADQAKTIIKNLSLKETFLEECIRYTLDELEGFSDEKIQEIYDTYYDGDEACKLTDLSDIRKALVDAKTTSNSVIRSRKDYEDIQKSIADYTEEAWKSRNSKEAFDKKVAQIDEMKKVLDTMDPDDLEYRRTKRDLEAQECAISMDFIMERVAKLTEKETSRVLEQFFSDKNGSYCMERCAARIKRFHITNPKWYYQYFNLEDHFLPEEYHPFNNLFLFAVMRFISYADPYDKRDQLFVHTMLNNLNGLVHHLFEDKEMEQRVILVIKSYDMFYMKYLEKFKAENTTWSGHPMRLEASAKEEADRKNAIIEQLTRFGIPIPEKEMTSKELFEYKEKEIDKLIEKNQEGTKEPSDEISVTDTEDGLEVKPICTKRGDVTYYYGDSCEPFTEFSKKLKEEGCEYYQDMLTVNNPEIAPAAAKHLHDEKYVFQPREIAAIEAECKNNIWFFLRYAVRVPSKDSVGNDSMKLTHVVFDMIRTSVVKNENLYMVGYRQSGKLITGLAIAIWKYFYDENVDRILLMGRDEETMKMMKLKLDFMMSLIPKFVINVRDLAIVKRTKTIGTISLNEYVQTMKTSPSSLMKAFVLVENFEYIPGVDDLFNWQNPGDLKPGELFKYGQWCVETFARKSCEIPYLADYLFNSELEKEIPVINELSKAPENGSYIRYIDIPACMDLSKEKLEETRKLFGDNEAAYQREMLNNRTYEEEVAESSVPERMQPLMDKIESEGMIPVEEFLKISDEDQVESTESEPYTSCVIPYAHDSIEDEDVEDTVLIINSGNIYRNRDAESNKIIALTVIIHNHIFEGYTSDQILLPEVLFDLEVRNITVENQTLMFQLFPKPGDTTEIEVPSEEYLRQIAVSIGFLKK